MPSNKSAKIRLHVRKEALKFSAAHMTVYPDGTKERMHGHNYRTELTIELQAGPQTPLFAFSSFKAPMKALCEQWDEKVLLPERCAEFRMIRDEAGEIEFSLCGKRYVLPRDEVELLPVSNIVTESLAMEFATRLIARLPPKTLEQFEKLELRIEEMTGQGATYIWSRGERRR